MRIDDKHLRKVMIKMCSYAKPKVSLKNIDTTKEEWYNEYTWTEKQQQSFRKWFVDYLYNDKDARNALLNRNVKSKKYLDMAVLAFIFDYGWRVRWLNEKI